MKGIQDNYSSFMGHNVYDVESRLQKAKKIIYIIKEFSPKKLKDCTILDYGSSTGIITKELSKQCKSVIGYDIDEKAVKFANKQAGKQKNIKFITNLKSIKNIKFDIIICNQIYEHVQDPVLMLEDLYKLIKSDGIIYFGATNKFRIIEPHYKLPFLSWIPKNLANLYIRTFTSHNLYYEDLLGYGKLYNLVNPYFNIKDITVDLIKFPKKYKLTDVKYINLLKFIPTNLLQTLKFMSPNWVWILHKKQGLYESKDSLQEL